MTVGAARTGTIPETLLKAPGPRRPLPLPRPRPPPAAPNRLRRVAPRPRPRPQAPRPRPQRPRPQRQVARWAQRTLSAVDLAGLEPRLASLDTLALTATRTILNACLEIVYASRLV